MNRWAVPILHEHKHYYIVNKVHGIVCQPPDLRTWYKYHDYEPPVLLDLLRKQHPNFGGEVWRTVHRLDEPVTGGVLVSRNKRAAAMFSRSLALGGNRGFPLTRRYVALLAREAKGLPSEGRITMGDMITDYKRLENDLVLLQLQTGRKHQIRKQMAQVFGQPVVNDKMYGGDSVDGIVDNLIGLHSAFIGAQCGLQARTYLIPIPRTQDAFKLWDKYIDEQGGFIPSVQKELRDFSLPSKLENTITLLSGGQGGIQISYK
ncbi:AGL134Cp [Eremothecium gossypii ATCC 10895]|uniref:21S rRNA pseudouridine(2819) synthase n=1 Tax=Eremothecium gossypii (strain ATCC 10895 / CBS 109.51 / FGSC 9923 / NRRL Y-1056) TaxID=284811 RepID=PUS5_EREGS|nr:AGL134Cp [Eremothecium gossypii ATCC 10895]Q750S3.1 RecName: Full=21S rRNA pseudouridine(2819) synthase; AltName: Full=Pseudouridine synthase 5; AltName: Full=Pseudouridylate synthase PUS5; AltName: Full=Uracil hydrolyase PUS5 [Eremothecium gossypii ATCC 10895]AAS54357.1 AGL134Cp [Eremothecium gossypii ATCC 10895]AEY98684.1 FAGL134Cp [Eremothecium gossypii FDAG1]